MTRDLFEALLEDEMAQLRDVIGAEAFGKGRFAEAIALFTEMSTADAFEAFLTLPAYRLLER